MAISAMWSRTALSAVRTLAEEHNPEIIHVHNMFPMLSPAVLKAVTGVPVFVTLHNFRLLCLPATLLRDGKVCEDCVGGRLWRGVAHRCYRSSLAGSAALAGSIEFHRRRGSFESVTKFLAVSEFVRDVHMRAGFDGALIDVKRNFAWPSEQRVGAGAHFLVLSRLSPEKGIDTVLAGWRPEFGRLIVAGDGPCAADLRAAAPEGVEFAGHVSTDAAGRLLREARALLVPSRCYEGAPRVVAEAFAAGVPVVASDLGALPELVVSEVNGVLAAVDDVPSWNAAVGALLDDDTATRLGQGARASWDEKYSPSSSRAALERLYTQAIEERSPGSFRRQGL